MDRNICCPTKPDIPKGIWEFIRKIPALRYLLSPVKTKEELYSSYSYNDLEPNNFAYVISENTFYVWVECEEHYEHYQWKPIKTSSIMDLFDIDLKLLSDGDILMFDGNHFKPVPFDLINKNEWTAKELSEVKN